MKRSEMLSYIEDELKDILESYDVKPKKYKLKDFIQNKADNILAMIEGFDMVPPYDPASDDEYPVYDWEPEV